MKALAEQRIQELLERDRRLREQMLLELQETQLRPIRISGLGLGVEPSLAPEPVTATDAPTTGHPNRNPTPPG